MVKRWPTELLCIFSMHKPFFNYEVLYVGQSYADVKRTAIDRLKSHSTLQCILSDTMQDYLDDQIIIFTFEYDDYFLEKSFNGINKTTIRGREDEVRLKSILENRLTKKTNYWFSRGWANKRFQAKIQ